MNQNLTKIFDGANLSGENLNVIYLPILLDGTLTGVDVMTDEAVAGDAVFSVSKNGVPMPGATAVTISTGNKIGSVSGLEIAVVKGDEITLDMTSGSVSRPLTLNLVVDDGVSTGGGSVPDWVTQHPDNPPSSSTSYDDEFSGASLDAKWTAYNSPNVTVANSFLRVKDTIGAAEIRSVLQNISALSGTGRFRCKLNFAAIINGQGGAGLILRNTTSGQSIVFWINVNTSLSPIVFLRATYAANNGALSSSGYTTVNLSSLPRAIYLDMNFAYPNLELQYSLDGINYVMFQANENVNAVRGTIASFSYIGFFIWTVGGTINSYNAVDWFRKI